MFDHFLSTLEVACFDLERGLVQMLMAVLNCIFAFSSKYKQFYLAMTAVAAIARVLAYW